MNTTTSTTVTAGGCPDCGFRVAYRTASQLSDRATCPQCGTVIRLSWTVGQFKDKVPCDDRCQFAIGARCVCSCGGVNHRVGYIEVEMVPTWVRERDARRAEQRKARAAAKATAERKARQERSEQLVADYPELADLLGERYVGIPGFTEDMRLALQSGELTERQIAAVVRMIRRDREYDAQRAKVEQRQAEAVAAGATHPTGKVEITGTVVSVRYQESHYPGRGCYKMLVEHEAGWRIWCTVPTALTLDYSQVDDLRSWREALPGQQVTLRGTCEASRSGDPMFGVLKRPALVAGPDPRALVGAA